MAEWESMPPAACVNVVTGQNEKNRGPTGSAHVALSALDRVCANVKDYNGVSAPLLFSLKVMAKLIVIIYYY